MILYNREAKNVKTQACLLLILLYDKVPRELLTRCEGITSANVSMWKGTKVIVYDKHNLLSKTIRPTPKLQSKYFGVPNRKTKEQFSNHDAHVFLSTHNFLINLKGKLISIDKENALSRSIIPDVTMRVNENGAVKNVYLEVETGNNTLDKVRDKIKAYNEELDPDLAIMDSEVILYVPISKIAKYEQFIEMAEGYKIEIRGNEF
jgi:hypothetical protein